MLVKQDYTDKSKSKYICDRCKTSITYENKVAIYIKTGGGNKAPKKKWDFCKRCYISLVKGVEK